MWQSEKNSKWVGARWGIGCFLLCHAFSKLTDGQLFSWILPLIGGAVFIAPEVAGFFADKFNLIGNVFWSVDNTSENIAPNYEFVIAKLKRDEIDRAEELLYEILDKHPEEVRAYIELIMVAVKYRKDRKLADSRLFKGLRMLKNQDDMEHLNDAYKGLISLLDDKDKFDANEKISTNKLKPVKKYYQRPPGV